MRSGLLRALVGLCILAVSAVLAGEPPSSPRLRLRVGTFDPVAGGLDLPGRLRLGVEPDSGHFVVQLSRGVDADLLERLRAAGATPLHYLPEQAYVVRIEAGRKHDVRRLPEVRWLGPIEPGFKLAPDLGTRPFRDPGRRRDGRLRVTIDLFPDADLAATARLVCAAGVEVLASSSFSDTRRIEARATPAQLEEAARLDAVAWIEEAGEITRRNNSATWVVQTNVVGSRAIWDRGLHGEGQTIGIVDDPMDMSSCYFRDPLDNTPGPTHRKVVAYHSSVGLGADPHGTHVAGIAAGSSLPINGSIDSAGHAYAARIAFANLADITGDPDPSNLYQVLTQAAADGARVHTNSWGDDSTTDYTTWSRDADLFSHDFEESLVVFSVSNLSAIRTPENAKNVVAVGATQNNSTADSFCVGGAGPTNDGRQKPDLVAPGCNIASARDAQPCSTRLLNGTSMASPAVAGAAALVRQYFVEGWYPSGSKQPADARTPSGALLKAMLLNSGADLGSLAGFPGPREGFGRVLLEDVLYFAGDTRRLVVLADARNASGLTTGASAAWAVEVSSAAEPLELTLAYTDPPAALLANPASINDLDLELIAPSGVVYRGNAFDPLLGESVSGGAADPLNNAETILLPAPEAGQWIVRVKGTAVNQGPQGYAVVATGPVELAAAGSAVRYAGHSVDDASAPGDGDGMPEPGETFRLPLDLLNLRPATATAVSARVWALDPDLAAVTRGSAAFPDLAPATSGSSLDPHFELVLSPAVTCGEAIPLRVRAQHGAGTSDSDFLLIVGDPPPATDDSCLPHDCPGDPVPGDVGPTLRLGASGATDLVFQWTALPGAASYRVWRWGTPDFAGAELLGTPATAGLVESGGRSGPTNWYYLVRAVNSCGWEGP